MRTPCAPISCLQMQVCPLNGFAVLVSTLFHLPYSGGLRLLRATDPGWNQSTSGRLSVPKRREPGSPIESVEWTRRVVAGSDFDPASEYEIWVQLLRGEPNIVDAADRAGVDRATVTRLRAVAKRGALEALASGWSLVNPPVPNMFGVNSMDNHTGLQIGVPLPAQASSRRRTAFWHPMLP